MLDRLTSVTRDEKGGTRRLTGVRKMGKEKER
jgi:hypothetical protein